MTKITDLTAAAPDSADVIPYVDVSDTTENAAGTAKKATMAQVVAAASVSSPLLTTIKANWTLAESSGERADNVGGYTLADGNTVTQVEGVQGPAAQFTAANSEYLEATSAADLQADGSFEIAFWARLDTSGDYGLIDKYRGGTAEYIIQYTSSALKFYLYDSTATIVTSTFGALATDTWYCIFASYDATRQMISLQVNLEEPDVADFTGTPDTGDAVFQLGRFNNIRPLNGRMWNVSLWKRVLTAAERYDYYRNGAGILYPFDGLTPVDVYIVAGQSNASGRGVNNQVVGQTGALMLGNDYRVRVLTDPLDRNTNQVDTVSSDASAAGSVWPLVAGHILDNTTNKRVMFVPCAMSSTTISDWQPGVDREDRTTLYGSMVYRAKLAKGTLKAVLWWHGESDALAGTTQATYNASLDTLANAINTDLGIPLMACKMQSMSGVIDANEDAINDAIGEAWSDNANVLQGPDFTDLASDDPYHLTSNANLTTAAARWWARISAELY